MSYLYTHTYTHKHTHSVTHTQTHTHTHTHPMYTCTYAKPYNMYICYRGLME